MDRQALLETWLREEKQPFAGWDFSYLSGRMVEDQPRWSYLGRAAELMASSRSVLDLDTGGGERLLDLQPHWSRRMVVTENYPPNTRLAYERLSPLGVDVLMAPSNEVVDLPFAARSFDLVLNRHGAFNSAEIGRILIRGGRFLTQQVHGLSLHNLMDVFGASPQWPNASPERYIPLLEAAGLTIVTVENWNGALKFSDVGAVVYFLKAVPWLVPGFNVQTYENELFGLQERLERGDAPAFDTHLYLIEAYRAN
jgi:SAM-dependent methyltransferase